MKFVTALVLAGHACAPPEVRTAVPSMKQLRNMTYVGVDERLGRVTLANGRWEGAPLVPGAASRPIVELADTARVVGDLDGDGSDDVVVHLSYTAGGSGTWSFLAVVARAAGAWRNVATAPLGDRVQIRSASIESGRLRVSALRAGPNDAACCPSQRVEWQWTLGGGRLNAVDTTGIHPLAGTSWQLVRFQGSDGLVLTPDDRAKYTITFGADARVSARIDCNRGSGTWTSAGPSQLEFGVLALTRAMCPPGSLHDRLVKDWGYVRSYVLKSGHLFLSLMADGGIYEFEPLTRHP